jgi:hypothetical protein
MIYLLFIWIAISALFIAIGIGGQRNGGALTLSYFLAFSLFHVPGALAYIDQGYVFASEEETMLGFQMTLVGMAAFTLGAIGARLSSGRHVTMPQYIQPAHRAYLEQLSFRMVIAGFVSYFILLPTSKFIPSVTALVGPLTALLILGLWLQLYLSIILHDWRKLLGTSLVLPLLPALTTITGGFIGFGVYWGLSVVAFFFVMARQRMWMIILAPLVIYLGLSLFVTYMRDRSEIRELVWEEKSPLGERVDRLMKTINNFEFLSLTDVNHLAALDARLNQNYYVGLAIQRHQQGILDLEYGGTVPIWAFVPRAIWPNKPEVGGGRTVVQDATGLELAQDTSFGAGQVLEFYINFGWPGVVIGFVALGALLRNLDRIITQSLVHLQIRKLLLCGMTGFVLLQPLGNLLEILVSAISALLVASILGRFVANNALFFRQTEIALVRPRPRIK